MKNILITGATGNIGYELLKFLFRPDTAMNIFVGVRDIPRAKKLFAHFGDLNYRYFDFENPDSFDEALEKIDCVFLLRPPQISNIDKYIRPLIQIIKNKHISEIVFLSVHGAEKSKVIPHNKIERLIREYDLDYIFLRPSYFMQNLTTTLYSDIKSKRKIILPAGRAKFNWIDIENIAETAAILLERFEDFKNQAIELTGSENNSFYEVVSKINSQIDCPIEYVSVNPLRFYRIKKKEGMIRGMIIVMIALHFLPRFQKKPGISDFYENLTGKQPTSLIDFIRRERDKFQI
jgi:uncharacterized protein YbjT (DUF2867 family)